jgi:hypothetical protein
MENEVKIVTVDKTNVEQKASFVTRVNPKPKGIRENSNG